MLVPQQPHKHPGGAHHASKIIRVMMMEARLFLLLCVLCGFHVNISVSLGKPASGPQPTHSGYFTLSNKPGSSLYYAYWEASNSTTSSNDDQLDSPILLWLQGGPGCASSFGAFYELGPYVTDENGRLKPNPHAWSTNFGLLIIDQPLGTGYSIAADEGHIPQDMAGMAEDLYSAIWRFFDEHPELQSRPFFITGESYAGKYIPTIAHYILQAESGSVSHGHKQQQQQQQQCRRTRAKPGPSAHSKLQPQQQLAGHRRLVLGGAGSPSGADAVGTLWRRAQQWWQGRLVTAQQEHHHVHSRACWSPRHAVAFNLASAPPPNFVLTGVAIGNGLTDPRPQTRTLASVVFGMGLVSEATQVEISQRTEDVVQLIAQGSWEQATKSRQDLLDFIQQESGVATLLDVRRSEGYDAAKAVDALLDSAAVRQWMNVASEAPAYVSCSPVVERVMAADVMRSCGRLMEDVLDALPVLLYQGQFDAQDGVAGTNAWVKQLDWSYIDDFEDQEGELWYAGSPAAAGWRRSASTLTQVVIRNAGHMSPRDQPQAARAMLEQWVADVLNDPVVPVQDWPESAAARTPEHAATDSRSAGQTAVV